MNSIEKEFVPYQESLELKELGFDEPCLAYYIELRNPSEGILTIDKCENNIDGVLTPTLSQAFRWFRDKHNINNCIIPLIDEAGFVYKYQAIVHREESAIERVGGFDTHEEAELACLRKLIEIVKDKKL